MAKCFPLEHFSALQNPRGAKKELLEAHVDLAYNPPS